jgi:hypothetical protein
MKKILLTFTMASMLFFGQVGQAHAQVVDIQQFLKEFGLDTAMTILSSRALDKIIDDSFNWAFGGFDQDELGFINNWGDFLEDTKHESISTAFQLAERSVSEIFNTQTNELNNQINEISTSPEYIRCDDELTELEDSGDGFSDLDKPCQDIINRLRKLIQQRDRLGTGGSAAEQNWNAWQSGELNSARSVVQSIASFGARELNIDEVEQLISGEGETLSTLLGSQAAKEAFKTDVTVGGYAGWIALADPHNTDAGLSSLVEGALAQKTAEEEQAVTESQQIENKFLDKTRCLRYEKDADGNDTSICAQEIATTPGAQIGSLVTENLFKEQDQLKTAKELSDIFAYAIGKLANKLLEKGLDALGPKTSIPVGGEADSNTFSSSYRSGFDLLGISKNNLSLDEEGGVVVIGSEDGEIFAPEQGNDASAPYIGGPEDEDNYDWNDGPEVIIDLGEVLGPAIERTSQELEFLFDTRVLRRELENTVYDLDQCIPGPDYGWEERFTTFADQIRHEDSNEQEHPIPEEINIGLSDTRVMSTDPRLNFPGGIEMKFALEQYLDSGHTNLENVNTNIEQKQKTLAILLSIQGEISEDFKNYKSSLASKNNNSAFLNLPLNTNEWESLSTQEKTELVSLRFSDLELDQTNEEISNEEKENLDETYLISGLGYYAISTEDNPAEILENDEESIRDAFIRLSWDIWRTEKGSLPAVEENGKIVQQSGAEQKSNLRYKYYINQNFITTQAQLIKAESEKDDAQKQGDLLEDYLSDCEEFRKIATNNTPQNYDGRHEEEDIGGDSNIVVLVMHAHKGWATPQEMRNILAAEYQKQRAGLNSRFKTTVMTSPASVENSIIGFETATDVVRYLNESGYSDDGLPNYAKNPLSVQNLIEQDSTTLDKKDRGWDHFKTKAKEGLTKDRRLDTYTGVLYCRTKADFIVKDASKDAKISYCAYPWYNTNMIEYRAALSGV